MIIGLHRFGGESQAPLPITARELAYFLLYLAQTFLMQDVSPDEKVPPT